MLYENLNEDSLKSRVTEDWFPQFDCTELDKNEIDFRVKLKHEANTFDFEEGDLLWAESKQHSTDIYKMLAQLLLTIRKNAYNEMPPKFIGCFDCKKIAFIVQRLWFTTMWWTRAVNAEVRHPSMLPIIIRWPCW